MASKLRYDGVVQKIAFRVLQHTYPRYETSDSWALPILILNDSFSHYLLHWPGSLVLCR